jgi:uncharacterized protein
MNVPTEAVVDETLAAAARAGGRLRKAAQRTDWGGYSGYFEDLDGHLWEVAYNPRSRLMADGRALLPTSSRSIALPETRDRARG